MSLPAGDHPWQHFDEEDEEQSFSPTNPVNRPAWLSWLEISQKLPYFVNISYINVIDRVLLREIMKRDTPEGDPYDTGRTWYRVNCRRRRNNDERTTSSEEEENYFRDNNMEDESEDHPQESWKEWITPWFDYDAPAKTWRVTYLDRWTFFGEARP